MKLIYRIGYYLGGFTIGLIILFFFLSGKKTSCDYGPNARVLKNIRSKQKTYTPEAKKQMQAFQLDSIFIDQTLQTGDVLFSESKTSLDSCNVYLIESKRDEKIFTTSFRNCDSLVTILTIDHQKN